MTNEIKEILEALRDSIDDTGTDKVNFINWVDKIEDCITNLQKTQETLIKNDNEIITNLQEEKENAVECLKYYEEKHFIKPAVDNTKLTIELYNAYLKEINDLQQRIDKAIEKLESIRVFGLRSGKTLFSTLINESIDILRGDDNE